MNKLGENMDWENEAPVLAKLNRENAFTVPAQYFEELGSRVNQAVFVSGLPKETGFCTPGKYFDTLNSQINSQIALSTVGNTPDGFNVPDGYFEGLQSHIVAKTKISTTVKIWHQPLFKYAVAASLVIASTGGWFANKTYQQKQVRKVELATEQMLYNIDEDMMLEYLQEDQNVKTSISQSEMENYILDNFSSSDLSNNL